MALQSQFLSFIFPSPCTYECGGATGALGTIWCQRWQRSNWALHIKSSKWPWSHLILPFSQGQCVLFTTKSSCTAPISIPLHTSSDSQETFLGKIRATSHWCLVASAECQRSNPPSLSCLPSHFHAHPNLFLKKDMTDGTELLLRFKIALHWYGIQAGYYSV